MGDSARTLSDDIYLLGDLLGDVIQSQAGQDDFALEEHVRALGKEFRSGNDDAARRLTAVIHSVSVDDAEMLIRAFTNYFQLVNLCEDNERIRRLKRRERENAPKPRRGSIREAVLILRDRGVTADQLAGDAQSGAGQARADGSPDRGAPPDHDRQAGADLPGAARSRRARGASGRARPSPHAARLDNRRALGQQRGPRSPADGAGRAARGADPLSLDDRADDPAHLSRSRRGH